MFVSLIPGTTYNNKGTTSSSVPQKIWGTECLASLIGKTKRRNALLAK